MVSLAANWDPAGRRECNDAHLHGGIELDDRPDLLRGWRRFDYGHRIPVGNTGSRMNTRRACAGRPQWRNYRARPRPRKTQRGGALCPGPKLPVSEFLARNNIRFCPSSDHNRELDPAESPRNTT